MGYPNGLWLSASAAVRSIEGDALITDYLLFAGSSGGPIFDSCGNVVAVNHSGITGQLSRGTLIYTPRWRKFLNWAYTPPDPFASCTAQDGRYQYCVPGAYTQSLREGYGYHVPHGPWMSSSELADACAEESATPTSASDAG